MLNRKIQLRRSLPTLLMHVATVSMGAPIMPVQRVALTLLNHHFELFQTLLESRRPNKITTIPNRHGIGSINDGEGGEGRFGY